MKNIDRFMAIGVVEPSASRPKNYLSRNLECTKSLPFCSGYASYLHFDKLYYTKKS